MRELLRFPLSDGGEIVVDVDSQEPGVGRAGRLGDAATRASMTYDQALDGVRRAADATLRQFRQMASRPDKVEVEFGVRLTAAAGAVISHTGAEAQLTVRLTWGASADSGPVPPQAGPSQTQAGPSQTQAGPPQTQAVPPQAGPPA
jgi:hypothetical protein